MTAMKIIYTIVRMEILLIWFSFNFPVVLGRWASIALIIGDIKLARMKPRINGIRAPRKIQIKRNTIKSPSIKNSNLQCFLNSKLK
jgi:sRNA-binding carbon storage regulator CsrA